MARTDSASPILKTTLGDYAVGRDNNFNLLRFCAATAVVINHSDAVVHGPGSPSILLSRTGMDLGNMAVDIFFITSGFLVTGSVSKRPLIEYAGARIRRILPALCVALLFCVFVIGLVFTTYSPKNFLLDSQTLRFIVKNATLVTGAAFPLPGVFESTPIPNVVNGSLWTLPWEARLYVILGCIALIAKFPSLKRRITLTHLLTFVAVSLLLIHNANVFLPFVSKDATRVVCMFFLGSAAHCHRDRIPLHRFACLAALLLLIASTFVNKQTFLFAYLITLPYLVMGFVYLPAGFIRKFNDLGDYSYGIYIYSFPLQQAIVASVTDPSPTMVLAITLPVVLAMAVLSWHFIEQPFLVKKQTKS